MSRKTFHREPPESRRQELIDATLNVIGDAGFAAATVRAISHEANVTQGLIRHHFVTKEDLICAAYEHHMSKMTDHSMAPMFDTDASALNKLRRVVLNTVSVEVMNERNLTLWASFIGKINTAQDIRATHERTYLQFRDGLAALIRDARREAGRALDEPTVRALAIQCNAVLDGIWIEGAAMPQDLNVEDARVLALGAVGALTGLDLTQD